MRYTVEFDAEIMAWIDYASVEAYEYRLLDERVYWMLVEYVEGMGYEWQRVAYTWEVVAA